MTDVYKTIFMILSSEEHHNENITKIRDILKKNNGLISIVKRIIKKKTNIKTKDKDQGLVP